MIEIDGASNSGIEEVRDIRRTPATRPRTRASKSTTLTKSTCSRTAAFNALLKTLEEPPPHVKFIFATTAAAKLPETILSRVQRFDFRRISNLDIVKKLTEICKAEKLAVPADVMALTARRARGSMRDALSLLDQILSFCGGKPDRDAVAGLLGALGDDEMARLLKMIREKDAAGLLKTASELLARGMDVGELLDQLTGYVRDVLVGQSCGADADLLDRSPEGAAAVVAAGKDISADQLLYIAEILNGARRRIREGQDDRIVLEMALVKLAQSDGLASVGELIEKLAALEEGAEKSAPPAPAAQYGNAKAPAPRPAVNPQRPSPPASRPMESAEGPDSAAAVREDAPADAAESLAPIPRRGAQELLALCPGRRRPPAARPGRRGRHRVPARPRRRPRRGRQTGEPPQAPADSCALVESTGETDDCNRAGRTGPAVPCRGGKERRDDPGDDAETRRPDRVLSRRTAR